MYDHDTYISEAYFRMTSEFMSYLSESNVLIEEQVTKRALKAPSLPSLYIYSDMMCLCYTYE